MRAAVTDRVGSMAVVDRPEPGPPERGIALVRPEAVGICGSDYSFFSGHMTEAAGGSQFPRVQGHEIGGRVVAVGPGVRPELSAGQRVAIMPLRACGRCYPCGVGRPAACEQVQLLGIHLDGGLQERLAVRRDQVHPIDVQHPAVAALAEPMSVAVRALRRGRLAAGERLLVLGAGPIGQCLAIAARALGAEVMVADPVAERAALAAQLGSETVVWTGADDTVAAARRWAGTAGPPIAIDATGAPAAVRAAVEAVCSAGRVVQVGMSPAEVAIRIGSLTEKELDLLGSSCMDAQDFARAVELVERSAPALARLVSHEFELERAPEAIRFAIKNPTSVMKVVIRGG